MRAEVRQCEDKPPWLRLGVIGGLFAIEIFLISVSFDASPLYERLPSTLGWLLSQAGNAVRVLIAIATMVVILGARTLNATLHALSGSIAGARTSPWLWLVHAVLFLSFFELTGSIFGGDLLFGSHPSLWGGLWLVCGLATAVSLPLIALPAEVLWKLVRPLVGVALTSIVIGLVAWGAGFAVQGSWKPLRESTFVAVMGLLSLTGQPLVVDVETFTLGLDEFVVDIAPQCSGYEGMGLVLIFMAAYLGYFRKELRFPHAFIVLPIAVVLAWSTNVLRVAALIVIGSWYSPDLAVGGFHSYSGSILWSGLALALAYGTSHSGFLSRSPGVGRSPLANNPSAAHLLPFLAIVAMTMLTAAASDQAERLYPLRILAAMGVLWYFRHVYRRYQWSFDGFAAGAGALVFALGLMMAESPPSDAAPASVAVGLAELSPVFLILWWAFRLMGSIVVVPIAEELAFRGYLMRRLAAVDFESVSSRRCTVMSVGVSSILFGAMHGEFLLGVLTGAVYALVMCRRGLLCDAIVAHATTNALLAASTLLSGRWLFW